MIRFFPLSRRVTRPISALMLIAWLAVMAVVVNQSYVQATGSLATGPGALRICCAVARRVLPREKNSASPSVKTVPFEDGEGQDGTGFELQEDGQLQMSLLGAHTITTLRTTARVNRAFELQSFDCSLDPGTGPIKIGGVVPPGLDLHISITSGGRTRTEVRRPCRAADAVAQLGPAARRRRTDTPGSVHQWNLYDPATLRERTR